MNPHWTKPPPGMEVPADAATLAGQARQVGEFIVRRDGALNYAMLLMVNASGELGEALVDPSGTDQERDATAAGLTEMMRRNRVVLYAFVSEGWFRTVLASAGRAEMRVSPSKAHDRREALFVVAQSETDTLGMAYPIERDAAGAFVRLGRNCLPGGGDVVGRFGRLLYPVTTH